jgi:nucleoside-diphosphate-sugar epimerase
MSRIVALTGATGFIGGAIAYRLRAENWQIKALARPTSNRDHLADLGLNWIEGDLSDLESLRRLVQGADAVVHCAGVVRGAGAGYFNHVNRYGVSRLVQAATERLPSPRFLLISSLAAREPHISHYAKSKRLGEEELAAGAGEMQWAVLRPSVVYGPGDKELLPLLRWMYRGIALVLGSNDARFSMLYVDDLADAVVQWLNCCRTRQQVFELDDGQPGGHSWEDLITSMSRVRGSRVRKMRISAPFLSFVAAINLVAARVTGYAPMLTPGKVRELRHYDWVGDNTMLTRETGWIPRVGLDEGLRRTLKSD